MSQLDLPAPGVISPEESGSLAAAQPAGSPLSAGPHFLNEKPLAPHAADWRRSRGRLFPEPPSPTRGEFQRDRDRLIHSTAFRRLAHKTQVFIDSPFDHVRTRLTHTIEVARIAKSLARQLGLEEDLAEAIALAHDLGHAPFGHAGEDALDMALDLFGGFNHNAQTLAIVERLERRYVAFDGLNLTDETIEGIIKHNGPLTRGKPPRPIPAEILISAGRRGIDLDSYPTIEAQCAGAADDIAYNCHDIEDGVRADVLTIEALANAPLIGDIIRHNGLLKIEMRERAVHEAVRRLMTLLVDDVIAVARQTTAKLKTAEDIRRLDHAAVAFSPAIAAQERELKAFLSRTLYRGEAIDKSRRFAANTVQAICAAYLDHPDWMPQRAQPQPGATYGEIAAAVRDYVSGMTDRFAIAEANNLHKQSALR